jgi:hypothetical protein
MASIIKGSKLFIGNQSLGFAIAEGLKVARILEVFYGKNNCHPQSENGHVGNSINLEMIERYINE